MKYARIQSGRVLEVIDPFIDADGREVPIEERFPASFCASLVEYDPDNPPVPAPDPAPSFAQMVAAFSSVIQVTLDGGAQAWGYDSLLSAASYAASTNAKFKAEAQALIAWRDAVWVFAATSLAAIQGGGAVPESIPAFVATLPAKPQRPE